MLVRSSARPLVRSSARPLVLALAGVLALSLTTREAPAQPPVFPDTLPDCVVGCNSTSACGRFDGPYDIHAMLEQAYPGCMNPKDLELNHLALMATPSGIAGEVLLWFNKNKNDLDDPLPTTVTSDTLR